MGTLARVKEGEYTIIHQDGAPQTIKNHPFIKINSCGSMYLQPIEGITSRDGKCKVGLSLPYANQGYFIAGPDVNDDYFISDACGIAIQLKSGDTLPHWSEVNTCGLGMMLIKGSLGL